MTAEGERRRNEVKRDFLSDSVPVLLSFLAVFTVYMIRISLVHSFSGPSMGVVGASKEDNTLEM